MADKQHSRCHIRLAWQSRGGRQAFLCLPFFLHCLLALPLLSVASFPACVWPPCFESCENNQFSIQGGGYFLTSWNI